MGNLSHFLHARTTFDALSIGVVVFVFLNGARAKKICARATPAQKKIQFIVEWGIVG